MHHRRMTRRLQLMLLGLAVIAILAGCGVEEVSVPSGLSITNSSSHAIKQVMIQTPTGQTWVYGPIGRDQNRYRPVDVSTGTFLDLTIRYSDGRAEHRRMYVAAGPPRLLEMSLYDDGHAEMSMADPDPGGPKGPDFVYVANDTSEVVHVKLAFAGASGSFDRKMAPYSIETDTTPAFSDGTFLGQVPAKVRMVYPHGKRYDAHMLLDLKPNEPLFFIVHDKGRVTVWHKPVTGRAKE